MAFAPWQAASRCTGAATPGARALMKWALDTHPEATNLGIYCCRNVRGSASEMSCHAEGRASDVGFPGRGNPAGHRLVQQLRPHAAELGVQAIIFDRTIWSAKSPGPAGRPYTGANPHYDHVHVELTRTAATKLTVATIRYVLASGARTLREGATGADVKVLQTALGVKPDGVFGPKTRAAVNRLKASRGWPADGVAGPRVRKVLGL